MRGSHGSQEAHGTKPVCAPGSVGKGRYTMEHCDDPVVTWSNAGTTYVLIGVEVSRSNPNRHYKVVTATTAEHRWVSCDCPAFTVSKKNRGKSQWERSCRHTEKYSLDSPPLSPQEYSKLVGIPMHQIATGPMPAGCPLPRTQSAQESPSGEEPAPSRGRKTASRFSYLEL